MVTSGEGEGRRERGRGWREGKGSKGKNEEHFFPCSPSPTFFFPFSSTTIDNTRRHVRPLLARNVYLYLYVYVNVYIHVYVHVYPTIPLLSSLPSLPLFLPLYLLFFSFIHTTLSHRPQHQQNGRGIETKSISPISKLSVKDFPPWSRRPPPGNHLPHIPHPHTHELDCCNCRLRAPPRRACQARVLGL